MGKQKKKKDLDIEELNRIYNFRIGRKISLEKNAKGGKTRKLSVT